MNRVGQVVHLLPCNRKSALQRARQRARVTCEIPDAEVDAVVQELAADMHGHGAELGGDGRRETVFQRVNEAGLADL